MPPEWGGRREDAKGKRLRECMEDLGLRVCNVGSTPTFSQGDRTSIIDVTFATPNIADGLRRSWRVYDTTETLSDHRYVIYREPGRPQQGPNGRGDGTSRRAEGDTRECEGWCLKKLKADIFRETMRKSARTANTDERRTPEELASEIRTRLEEACDAAAPRRKRYHGKRTAYWWSEQTAEARRKCTAARRRLQRARPRPQSAVAEQRKEEYRKAKKLMRLAIRKGKEKAWREMTDTIEKDPWGMPYKLCMGKLRPRQVLHRETVEEAVNKLFPDGEEIRRSPDPSRVRGPERTTSRKWKKH